VEWYVALRDERNMDQTTGDQIRRFITDAP